MWERNCGNLQIYGNMQICRKGIVGMGICRYVEKELWEWEFTKTFMLKLLYK